MLTGGIRGGWWTAESDESAGAIDGHEGAFGDAASRDLDRGVGVVDGEVGDADDGGFAHCSCHDCGVTGGPAACGDDSRCGGQAVYVVGGCLWTREDGRTFGGHADRCLGRGRNSSNGHSGAGSDPTREDVGLNRVRDARDAGLLQVTRRNPEQCLGSCDGLLIGEVDREADGGGADKPAGAGLEQPKLSGLEGELDIARIAVVVLDAGQCVCQRRPDGRFSWSELMEVAGSVTGLRGRPRPDGRTAHHRRVCVPPCWGRG